MLTREPHRVAAKVIAPNVEFHKGKMRICKRRKRPQFDDSSISDKVVASVDNEV